MDRDLIKDALLGVAIGDAIGVPVEFRSRHELTFDPVTGMREYGTHGQPAGTWSDDSSLTFCLAEMLCREYDLEDLAHRFVNWEQHGYWTPHGKVFDIGLATTAAIHCLATGTTPLLAGGVHEGSNGNGSLMRILPLAFFIRNWDILQRFKTIKDVSSLTHRHIRSVIACFIYVEVALEIIAGKDKISAYRTTCSRVSDFLEKGNICSEKEHALFRRSLSGEISKLPMEEIRSTGYVIHTLEASLWCILNTFSYQDAVLKAANLGEDSDTTAAVTGGLAGLIYGSDHIPADWLATLVRRGDIEDLSQRLNVKLR